MHQQQKEQSYNIKREGPPTLGPNMVRQPQSSSAMTSTTTTTLGGENS